MVLFSKYDSALEVSRDAGVLLKTIMHLERGVGKGYCCQATSLNKSYIKMSFMCGHFGTSLLSFSLLPPGLG